MYFSLRSNKSLSVERFIVFTLIPNSIFTLSAVNGLSAVTFIELLSHRSKKSLLNFQSPSPPMTRINSPDIINIRLFTFLSVFLACRITDRACGRWGVLAPKLSLITLFNFVLLLNNFRQPHLPQTHVGCCCYSAVCPSEFITN